MRDDQDGIDPKQRIGAKVAFFSLEMSADQLATRVLAEQSKISSQDLRMGKISQSEMDRLVVTSGELQNLPFVIDDTAGLTIGQLHTRMRRLQRRHGADGIGMVVVDYLQLLTGQRAVVERQSRAGDFGNQPRAEDAGQGFERARARAVAAQPRGRAARGQAPAAVGSARIGIDRAGRRRRAVRLSRGLLRRGEGAQAPGRRRRRQGVRRLCEMGPGHGARQRPRGTDRRQAAPRIDRQGHPEVRAALHVVQRLCRRLYRADVPTNKR